MKHLPYDLSPEELQAFTPDWQGERDAQGRPMAPDQILDEIERFVSIPYAWGILKAAGYVRQTLWGYDSTRPNEVMVGRAATASYLPHRPDLRACLMTLGHGAGEIGDMVSWPIERLQKRDVYVADVFGKVEDGPIIGERLGSAIYARTGCGCVHSAAVRDIDGILSIDGFNVFHRGVHPSHASPDTVSLMGINCPIRMDGVCVMPGDVVLAKGDCVVFIPPQLAEKCAVTGMLVYYQDQFAIARMREKIYHPGEIDAKWTAPMMEDFFNWLDEQGAELTREQAEKLYAGGERLW